MHKADSVGMFKISSRHAKLDIEYSQAGPASVTLSAAAGEAATFPLATAASASCFAHSSSPPASSGSSTGRVTYGGEQPVPKSGPYRTAKPAVKTAPTIATPTQSQASVGSPRGLLYSLTAPRLGKIDAQPQLPLVATYRIREGLFLAFIICSCFQLRLSKVKIYTQKLRK